MMDEPKIFWREDTPPGTHCTGGYFFRCDLGPQFEKMKDEGYEIYGIRIAPGDLNAEFLWRRI